MGGIWGPDLDGVPNGRTFNRMADASSLTLQVVSVTAVLVGFGYWVTRLLASVESTSQMVLQRVPVRADRRRR